MIVLTKIENGAFTVRVFKESGDVKTVNMGFEDIRAQTYRAKFHLSALGNPLGDSDSFKAVPNDWFNRVRYWAHCMEVLVVAHKVGFKTFDFLGEQLLKLETLAGDIDTPLVVPSSIGGANMGIWEGDCYLLTSPLAADEGRTILVSQGKTVLEDEELTQSELDAGENLNELTILTDMQRLRQPYLVNDGDLFCDLFGASVAIVLNAHSDRDGNISINKNAIANVAFLDR